MTYQETQIGKLFLDIIRDFYEKHPELKDENGPGKENNKKGVQHENSIRNYCSRMFCGDDSLHH